MKFSQLISKSRRAAQRGISTIAVIGAVAIGAIVLVGGLGIFSGFTSAQGNNDASNIGSMVSSVKQYGATHNGGFSSVTTSLANQLGWFPSSVVSGSTTVGALSSGANVTVASTTIVNANDGVAFTISGYKSSLCTDLLQKAAPLVNTITVGGTAVKANGAALADATAATQCAAGADNTTIVIGVKG